MKPRAHYPATVAFVAACLLLLALVMLSACAVGVESGAHLDWKEQQEVLYEIRAVDIPDAEALSLSYDYGAQHVSRVVEVAEPSLMDRALAFWESPGFTPIRLAVSVASFFSSGGGLVAALFA